MLWSGGLGACLFAALARVPLHTSGRFLGLPQQGLFLSFELCPSEETFVFSRFVVAVLMFAVAPQGSSCGPQEDQYADKLLEVGKLTGAPGPFNKRVPRQPPILRSVLRDVPVSPPKILL